ncbi:MAG: 2-hydroxychromene-2-carboxylate isomerase [Polyangiaceae bacterium]
MAELRVQFYFDFISPYAYLAWTRIHAVAARAGAEVEPIPILFAGLLEAHGTKGPAEVPAKRAYLFKDVYRTARVFGVPFDLPPAHPFNPLLALRVASAPSAAPAKRALIDALFSAVWGERGGGVTDPANVAALVEGVGLDPKTLLDEAAQSATKELLRRRTREAIEAGIFGVPTTVVNGEIFWGVDSLGHAERAMRGEDPIEPALVERFANLPTQAVRPGAVR